MTEPTIILLTPGQRRVFHELIRDGADNATIGLRLHITEDTVKTHAKGVIAAFGVHNRTAVLARLLKGGIVIRTKTGAQPKVMSSDEAVD